MLLAPTLLVGTVYGMHFNHMPELYWLQGYAVALPLITDACNLCLAAR